MIWMLLRGFISTGTEQHGYHREKIIPKSKFALDKYHMHKYIIAATSHLEDSAEDARGEYTEPFTEKEKWMAEGAFDRIIESQTKKQSERQ